MKLVVDASVAVKWVVAEEGRAEALRRTAGQELIAPEFVLIEVSNILWKKVRLRHLDREQAQRGLEFVAGAYERLLPTSQLIHQALFLALELDHPVYDCLYLACSDAENAKLIICRSRF